MSPDTTRRITMRRLGFGKRHLVLFAIAALIGFGWITSRPNTVHAETTTAYHYWAYNIATCQTTATLHSCSMTGNWWTVTVHAAGWANGSSVQFASRSGFPYCTASGYEITIMGCHAYGGGTEVYVEIDWQNCIAAFNIGCFDDFATVGFSRTGAYNYYHEDWGDGLP